MKQEDKELLLRDLCGRLPYGVKCRYQHIQYVETGKIIDINRFGRVNIDGHIKDVCDIKPYLLPLSSMTEEQKEEYGKCYDIDLANCAKNLCDRLNGKDTINGYPMYNHIDWCNKNHFDYRGLIEKGLAIDCTNLDIY